MHTFPKQPPPSRQLAMPPRLISQKHKAPAPSPGSLLPAAGDAALHTHYGASRESPWQEIRLSNWVFFFVFFPQPSAQTHPGVCPPTLSAGGCPGHLVGDALFGFNYNQG